MAEEREVVVTGLGAVTALGRDVPALWEALVAGRSGIGPIEAFDASSYPSRVAGEIRGYTPHQAIDAQAASSMDRGVLFAIDAALQAVQDARLPITDETASHLGLVLGSARPGETSVWEGQERFWRDGTVPTMYLPRTLPNTMPTQVAAILALRGPVIAVSAGGASGTAAIALAASLVRSGEVEVAITGGADAAITPPALAGFCALKILTEHNGDPAHASRPFDAAADGMVLAEGAGVIVLENAELAAQRGARVYARLAGDASVTEPGATVPTAREAARAFKGALHRPALMQSEIDYLCAYGCGMPAVDRMETDAIKQVFGAVTASKVTLSAPKSMLGHLLGASGGIDAIVCAKAIETGTIPPTINLEQPAEGCDLDYTPGTARRQPVRHAMTYAYGFGGQHVALCFSAP